mmetsp:Transcript_28853/g.43565  ORF Transcript_28853/g.43565 Transcript_28853/m.43565 type:complete len:606 (+) Transcript_28853:48-1865(+)|eukprot:CAMPEP_0178908626 /NCGR_PEP_ID=MMETSP0786-20121207/8027_1 /TAXON_ID=186022 /ORGANISM="Thalassionema frauenfeldii, Strain CCMP 1798" /LENGTH=605 /DNA_ID=CAMNT_0020580549 /DNA_START=29 /DNA_END=1846 /DNA_ORIENTATION=-
MPHLKASDKVKKNEDKLNEEVQKSDGEGETSTTEGGQLVPQTKVVSTGDESHRMSNEPSDSSTRNTDHPEHSDVTQSPSNSALSKADDAKSYDKGVFSSPNRASSYANDSSTGTGWTESPTKKRECSSKDEEVAVKEGTAAATVSPESKSRSEESMMHPNGMSIKRRKLTENSPAGDKSERNQRIISPSSSSEGSPSMKPHDEDNVTAQGRKSSKLDSTEHAQTSRLSAPPDVRFTASVSHPYHTQFYPPRPMMYGYPPMPHHAHLPPPQRGPHHHAMSPPPPPGWRYPQYPQGHPGAFPPPPYHTPYPPQHPSQHPHQYPSKTIPVADAADAADARKSQLSQHAVAGKPSLSSENSASSSKRPEESSTTGPKIKSVAEWQQAALTTGKAPSANRCVPLKAPIPSKYWGEAEKTKDVPIPDFHQLVNFPDYLHKVRSNGGEAPGSSSSNNGKRPCVMCGKQRICSASTANLGGSVLRRGKKSEDGAGNEEDEEDSNHIIPRQNKGLCTACDVTVWVVVDTAMEIKWCKGCKNFRPWAAFGDKGLATKCVRCRDRQREKYALQKDELRLRRLRQNNGKRDNKVAEGQHEIDAAKGLRNLMAATSHV